MRRTGESDEGIVEERADETLEKNSVNFDVIKTEAFDFLKSLILAANFFKILSFCWMKVSLGLALFLGMSSMVSRE